MSDLKERLDETRREEEWATTWRPDAGETLVGTFETMDHGTTQYGEAEVAHIRDEGGQLWGVWLFHTVLEEKWREATPTEGDRVGIVYLGKRAGSDFDYHTYSVEVERHNEPQSGGGKNEGESDLAENGESTMEEPNGSLPY